MRSQGFARIILKLGIKKAALGGLIVAHSYA